MDEIPQDDPTVATFKREQIQLLNQAYKRLSRVFNFERELVIFRLINRGFISMDNLGGAFGIGRERISQIYEKFKKQYPEIVQVEEEAGDEEEEV